MDYLSYFELTAEPFSNAPLSRFYYGSRQHTDALERLRYAASTMKGLAILVGDIGLGKTTLARRLLEALPESEYEAAMLVIVHAGITPNWLLKRIAIQLAVPEPADDKLTILSQLYQRLVQIHESGKKAVVLIDEAQMLASRELMEEFRGLLNLEVPERKLISFIFFGLPEIEQNLRLDPPLAQRIALRYHLKPLGVEDTHAYVRHRLSLAGAQDREIFTWSALDEIYRFTRGVPRLINTLCDNLLLELFFAKTTRAEAEVVRTVAQNLGLTPKGEAEPLPPVVEPARDEPALADGPGADAIVAVSRDQEQTPEAPAPDVLEPDSIAAQVASEPMIEPMVESAAEPGVEITPEPVVEPAAEPVPSLPEYGAEEPSATLPIVPAPVPPFAALDVSADVPVESVAEALAEAAPPQSAVAEDRGPPPVPLKRAERTTVDIEDPLAFLSSTAVPESAAPGPSPWQAEEEGTEGEGGEVPELAATDLEVVDSTDNEEPSVEVDVDTDDALFADTTPPLPIKAPTKPPPPALIPVAAKPEPEPAPEPKPQPKPAAKPPAAKSAASKGIDLSEIDAFLADLNLPPKKK